MNITFSWKCDSDRCAPVSKSDLLNKDGLSLLDCVLMDDGGLTERETLHWLTEGIERIKRVQSGELQASDWCRETWGVQFSTSNAKIYSLYDEEYYQIIPLESFFKVLQEWCAFHQSEPVDRSMATRNFSIDA